MIKVALIGCGRISSKHGEAIQKNNIELVAACDIIGEKVKDFCEKYGGKPYTDYKEMLKSEKPDLVAIATPNGTHPEITKYVASKKINVLTEKPMALSLADADSMIDACKKNKVKFFVVKQNRFNPPIVRLKEAMQKGRFGKVVTGNVTVYWTRPQKYYDEDDWHGTIDIDGGMLLNQASHHIDMLQWMMGNVVSVKAYSARIDRDIDTEDTAVAVLKFENGSLGVIQATVCTYPKNMDGSITILGTKGSVKIGGTAMNRIDEWIFEDYCNDDDMIKSCSTNPENVYGYGHSEVYKQIMNNLTGKNHNSIDGSEGRHSLELILAIYKSAVTGKEIFLPLDDFDLKEHKKR